MGVMEKVALTTVEYGGHAAARAVGDFNGDGLLDILFGGPAYGPYAPAGGLWDWTGEPQRYWLFTIDQTGALTDNSGILPAGLKSIMATKTFVADFNGDGVDDVFIGTSGHDKEPFPGELNILLLSSGGSLVVGSQPDLIDFTHSLSGGDVDGDGDIDVFVGNLGGTSRSGPHLLINDGLGRMTFATTGFSLPWNVDFGFWNAVSGKLGDIDGDNDLDYVGVTMASKGPLALLNDGTGHFTERPAPSMLGAFANPIVPEMSFIDFDRDGDLDAVFSHTASNPPYDGSYIQFMRNDGAGTFTDVTAKVLGSQDITRGWADNLYIVDFNGDGYEDIIVSRTQSVRDADSAILINDGAGNFIEFTAADLGITENSWVPIDYNNDGRVDIVAFSRNIPTHDRPLDIIIYKNMGFGSAWIDPVVQMAAQNVLRIGLGEPNVFLDHLAAEMTDGLTRVAALSSILDAAKETSSVATLTYQFFTGLVPSRGGMDYLIAENGPNPNNLNSDYYQFFNLTNRFINFSVNLGTSGAGRGAFEAEYGSLSLSMAMTAIYAEVFGRAPTAEKVDVLLNTSLTLGAIQMTRAEYFAYYGGDGINGLGTKAAMAGWLLAVAANDEIGMYGKSNAAYMLDLLDGAEHLIDLIGTYGRPEYAFGG